jgi:hypothetical protein
MIEEERRQRELPINRAIHQLRSGVPEENIRAASLGVPPENVPEIDRIAKSRIVENDRAYAAMTRRGAVGYMIFGLALLALGWFLSTGDVPVLRRGQLVVGLAFGAASLCWGLFRFFNHDPRHEL